jgi:hypothetical protein
MTDKSIDFLNQIIIELNLFLMKELVKAIPLNCQFKIINYYNILLYHK